MKWNVVINKNVAKEFAKLDKSIQKRISIEIDKIIESNDPRQFGKALTGSLSGLWRYRVGDYRIISKIEDNTLTILVIKIANRKDVYR